MSERSEWSEPAPKQPLTHEQAYAPRLTDDVDVDNMMMLVGGEKAPEAPEAVESTESVDPFAIGREVTVMRSAQGDIPAYQDGGWKIIDNASKLLSKDPSVPAKPAVIVEKIIDGKSNIKRVSLDTILSLNPDVIEKTEIQTDEVVSKKMGETALESIGVEKVEDSGIDEDQHFYSRSQIREMREEANRRAEPTIPDLEAKMSGEVDPMIAVRDMEEKLRELQAGLSQSDVVALWKYSNAVNDMEQRSAEDRMSTSVRDGNLRFTYKQVTQQLRDARVAAGILDPQ